MAADVGVDVSGGVWSRPRVDLPETNVSGCVAEG